MLPVDDLHEHPANPRKHFNPQQLADLEASIIDKGVLVPLSVRKLAKGHQVLGGARRRRAAKGAGLKLVPCLVRECDDNTALELVVLDNRDRSDLHPLEDADGLFALSRLPGYDVAKVASKIGRPVAYVRERLKLLGLTKESRALFLEDRFTAGHALLLAKLSPADQARAIKPGRGYDDVGLFREDMGERDMFEDAAARNDARKKNPLAGMTTCSVREFATWIDLNVRVDPKHLDTVELFPEMAHALKLAEAAQARVLQISHDSKLDFPESHKAKGKGEPILFAGEWRPADGEHKYRDDKYNTVVGRKCDRSHLGVVVIGRGRGEAFDVCVDRACEKHWPKAKAAHAAKTDPREAARRAKIEAAHKRQRDAHVALQGRWRKAAPAMREALAAKVKTASVAALGELLLKRLRRQGMSVNAKPLVARGKTADDLVRYLSYVVLAEEVGQAWGIDDTNRKLRSIGVDTTAVLNAAAPAAKPAKKKAAGRRVRKGTRK